MTEEILIDAYRAQAVERGVDPDTVRVQIIGEPDFAQNEASTDLDDFEFATAGGQSVCEVTDEATGGVQQPAEPIPSPHSDQRPGV